MRRERKTEQGEPGFGCPLGDRVEGEVTKEARSIETPEATAVGSVELKARGFPNPVKRYEEPRTVTQRLSPPRVTH